VSVSASRRCSGRVLKSGTTGGTSLIVAVLSGCNYF